MRTLTARSLGATLATAALAAGVLAAPLPAQAAPAVSPAMVTIDGPYCPDHPDVPRVGEWVSSRIRDGHHIDTYEVPYYWGFIYVDVVCD